MTLRLGLFGGTFDPIHLGHLEVVRAAFAEYQLQKVIFIPAFQSPFKYQSPEASAQDRLAMTRLALEGFSHPYEVSDWEIKQGRLCYTVEVLEWFRSLYPEAQLFWLMGADGYDGFSKWKNPERILELADLLVAPRVGHDLGKLEKKAHKINMEGVDLSSTGIRQTIITSYDQACDKKIGIPLIVQQYIQKHRLYHRSF